MPATTERDADGGRRATLKRLAWFAALWLAGVAAVGALAYALRAIVAAVG